jgi:hypothetical protein
MACGNAHLPPHRPHPPAPPAAPLAICRYVCVLGAGDTKLEVREEGIRGLRQHPSQQQQKQKQQVAEAAAGGAEAAAAAAVGAVQPHPSLAAALQYVCGQQPRLARLAEAGEQLALPQRSFLALIRLLQVGGRELGEALGLQLHMWRCCCCWPCCF